MKLFIFAIFILVSFYFAHALSVDQDVRDKKANLVKTLQSKAGWNSGSYERRRYGGRYRNPYNYNRYNDYNGYNNNRYNQGYYSPYNNYYYYTTPRKNFFLKILLKLFYVINFFSSFPIQSFWQKINSWINIIYCL
jgi:hypothetical protein